LSSLVAIIYSNHLTIFLEKRLQKRTMLFRKKITLDLKALHLQKLTNEAKQKKGARGIYA